MSERSPIKDRPLRNPGQSLEEQRRALIEDKIFEPLLVALLLVLLACLEWYRYLVKMHHHRDFSVLLRLLQWLMLLGVFIRFVRKPGYCVRV